MKISVTKKVETTEVAEVTLPKYYKENNSAVPDYVAMLTEDEDGVGRGLCVYGGRGIYFLSATTSNKKDIGDKNKFTEITAEEFHEQYLNAMEYYGAFAPLLGMDKMVRVENVPTPEMQDL